MPGFLDCVRISWEAPVAAGLSAPATLSVKFKRLRFSLKRWSTNLSSLKRLATKCSEVVLYFDCLEEIRPLTRPEFNFRKIVKLQYEGLLKLHHIYWKHRCTIRYILVGDENSKFFHAMASEGLRGNSISCLQRDDGSLVSEHDQMAGILWNSFKSRMGQP